MRVFDYRLALNFLEKKGLSDNAKDIIEEQKVLQEKFDQAVFDATSLSDIEDVSIEEMTQMLQNATGFLGTADFEWQQKPKEVCNKLDFIKGIRKKRVL